MTARGKVKVARDAEKRVLFLASLLETASVTESCKKLKINRPTVYLWRDQMPEFAQQWDDNMLTACDVLEDEAVRRGRDGYLRPVYQGGKKVGTERRYSDTLLMFILNGRRPEKFSRSRVEHTGANGGAIKFEDASLLESARRVAFLLNMGQLTLGDAPVTIEHKGESDG